MFYKILNNKVNKKKILTDDEAAAVRMFNDYQLSKEFGYTPQQIRSMPQSYYDDYITIGNMINAKNNPNQGQDTDG